MIEIPLWLFVYLVVDLALHALLLCLRILENLLDRLDVARSDSRPADGWDP